MTRAWRCSIFAVIVVVLAACGSDDEGNGGTATEAEAGIPPVKLEGTVNDEGTGEISGDAVEIEADDFYFEPTFVRGEPGATVTVEVFNEGDASHTFTIDEQNVDVTLDPDARDSVEVTLPDSGNVRFYCRFHAQQGMQGAFFTSG